MIEVASFEHGEWLNAQPEAGGFAVGECPLRSSGNCTSRLASMVSSSPSVVGDPNMTIRLAFWYFVKYLGPMLRVVAVFVIVTIPLVWAVLSLHMVNLTWLTRGVILAALIISTCLLLPILS